MSGARPPRLTRAKSSTHIWGRRNHLTAGCMGFAHGICFAADFYEMLQNRVVAMPLNEVRAAHERAMLGRASIIVPEIEVLELDGVLEWVPLKDAFLAQLVHDRSGGGDFLVGCVHDLFRFTIDSVNKRTGMAL